MAGPKPPKGKHRLRASQLAFIAILTTALVMQPGVWHWVLIAGLWFAAICAVSTYILWRLRE